MTSRSLLTSCALAATLAVGAGAAQAQTGGLEAAIENDARTPSNVERDGERKPAELLTFLDLQPGDAVVDIFAGGGYWTELFADAVGPEGTVYATGLRGEYPEYGNIEAVQAASGEGLPLEDESVDMVFMSYVYHHMHYAEGEGENTPEGTLTQLADFHRILEPGGRVVIVEHQAVEDTTREESSTVWHRAAPHHIRADLNAAGFEFADEAPEIYNNPDDPMNNMWRDAGLAGHTTSLVHVYTKPE